MRVPRHHSLLSAGMALALHLLAAPAASPAPASEDEAFTVLGDAQIVTGATKRPEPLSDTPSSVTVITAAELRANGFRSLADALRWVRGLYVTYDRNYSYLGVRGLQRPGDYNNKMLLAIDGHKMNGPVYGDASFGPELGLDLEIVERIEVVRGPGSALYGSNAVLAVVNVVTRRPSSEPGLALAARAGSGDERRAFASISGSRPDRPEWMLSGSVLDSRGRDLWFPENAPTFGTGAAIGLDGERAANFYGVVGWNRARLAVKLNRREKDVPTGSFGADFGDPRNHTTDSYDFVELSGTRNPAPGVELHARAYWDSPRYRGDYVYGSVVNRDFGYADTWGSEWRGLWSAGGRHVVIAGVEGRWYARRVQRNYDVDPHLVYLDTDTPGLETALYIQDEARVSRALRITAGARADHDPRFDPVLSPRLDLVWKSSEATRWKLLLGSAYRAPSVYETDYSAQNQIPNATLRPERVRSAEGSWVHSRGRLGLTLCAYANHVRDLIDLTPVDVVGTLQFRNRAEVISAGAESQVDLVAAAGTRVSFDLAFQQTRDVDTDSELSNSPRWSGHVLISHAPYRGRLSGGFGVRWLSQRRTLLGRLSPPAVVTDARLQWRMDPRMLLSLDARNLLDSKFGDPASGEQRGDVIVQDARALYVTLTLRPGSEP